MVKRVMKQRVAVAFVCTVWLTSIVGASVPPVPLEETTAFPNLRRPSGPSSDQYTPLLRIPSNYQRQDHHGRGYWMNDPHPGINARNQREKSLTSDLESPPPNYELRNNREKWMNPKEYNAINGLKNDRGDIELDNAEAQRLSSIKLAFDDPIDFSDEIEEENEEKNEGEEEEEEEEVMDWRRDGMKEEGDMQRDEFLGDDTFEDEGPGSVEVYKLDLFRDTPTANQRGGRRLVSHEKTKSKIPKKVNVKSTTTRTTTAKEFEDIKSREDEEDEEKRGKNLHQISTTTRSLKERIFGTGGVPELQVGCEGVEGSQQREKRSGDNESNKKRIGIPVLPSAVYTDIDYDLEDYYDLIGGPDDPRYSVIKSSRGDMNPKIKTPADIEARKILLKGKLPKRGDLAGAWEESLSQADRVRGDDGKGMREKRNIKSTNDEGENDNKEDNHRGGKSSKRRHRRKGKLNVGRNSGENNKTRRSNELRNRKKELKISKRNLDDNDEKLADYIRRNTPINRMRNDSRKFHSDRRVPLNLIYQYRGRGPDIYADKRRELLEQRRPKVRKINRTIYEAEQAEEKKRKATNVIRPNDQLFYKGRTREEIERLKSLPVQSLIVIEVKNSSDVPSAVIESRFGNEDARPSTSSPLVRGPSPCAWAIINCCSNQKRLTTCFEANRCPGGHWDDPCTTERFRAAVELIGQHYLH